jgi:hypothetical protein
VRLVLLSIPWTNFTSIASHRKQNSSFFSMQQWPWTHQRSISYVIRFTQISIRSLSLKRKSSKITFDRIYLLCGWECAVACCNLISSKLREEVPGASLQQNAKIMLAPGDEIWWVPVYQRWPFLMTNFGNIHKNKYKTRLDSVQVESWPCFRVLLFSFPALFQAVTLYNNHKG